jgi:ubiquinone/menaquinone biosynthesis C-methylase UbiE
VEAPNPKERIAATYNAASDRYDDPALNFWQYYGEQGSKRARLLPGETVLDVCSGTGASAIPAARAVGTAGRVIGLDLAQDMIALAREKAAAEGLGNVEFRHADFDQAYFRNASFDAVQCCFGLFFFPDMTAALRKMWRLLRPGGRLAILTWGRDSFEPGNTAFWDAVRAIRPEHDRVFAAWEKLADPQILLKLFGDAGIGDVAIETEEREHPLRRPEDWWTIVMGSGYRWTVDQLSEEERERLRSASLGLGYEFIKAPANYAIAIKS